MTIGMTKILGVNYILSNGNQAIGKVGKLLSGSYCARIILIFVVISVFGVVNDLVIGNICMPQALDSKQMIPGFERTCQIHPRLQVSVISTFVGYVVCLIWFVLHYFTQRLDLFHGCDVSEIAIVFSYECYIILYVKVMHMKKMALSLASTVVFCVRFLSTQEPQLSLSLFYPKAILCR